MTHNLFTAIRRPLAAVALVLTMGASTLAMSGPASAAITNNRPGPYRQGTCLWGAVFNGGLDEYADRVVRINFPTVAAYNATTAVDKQYVYASAQAYFRYNAGGPLTKVGDPSFVWTYASDNAWQHTWYPLGSTASTPYWQWDTQTFLSGSGPDAFEWITVSWVTNGVITGQVSYWAQNPANVNNTYVCSGGGNAFVVY